jgi:hypothetical protein
MDKISSFVRSCVWCPQGHFYIILTRQNDTVPTVSGTRFFLRTNKRYDGILDGILKREQFNHGRKFISYVTLRYRYKTGGFKANQSSIQAVLRYA